MRLSAYSTVPRSFHFLYSDSRVYHFSVCSNLMLEYVSTEDFNPITLIFPRISSRYFYYFCLLPLGLSFFFRIHIRVHIILKHRSREKTFFFAHFRSSKRTLIISFSGFFFLGSAHEECTLNNKIGFLLYGIMSAVFTCRGGERAAEALFCASTRRRVHE